MGETSLNLPEPVFVVVAHQDDWQIFMGSEVYAHLRDPEKRVVIIVTTAGDAGDSPQHWKSRFSGAILSVVRALPSWSPYRLHRTSAPPLPASFSVSYREACINGKPILAVEIASGESIAATMYFMHLPDGGGAGEGFAPRFESLTKLRAGTPARALWPEESGALYATWNEFELVIETILRNERGNDRRQLRVYAANPDISANPGDHLDHTLTSHAVAAIAARNHGFEPIWFSMYCIAGQAENLDAAEADTQRAAIYSYGAGYTATAAEFSETWRRSWEREYPHFKNRQYLKNGSPRQR